MLYATEGVNSDDDFQKAMIGVASVWSVRSFFRYARSSHFVTTKQVRRKPVRPSSPQKDVSAPLDARPMTAGVTAICSVSVSV